MMASMGEVTVRLRAIDEMTPVIRRAARHLWWFQYGAVIITVGLALIVALTFALGFVLGAVWS